MQHTETTINKYKQTAKPNNEHNRTTHNSIQHTKKTQHKHAQKQRDDNIEQIINKDRQTKTQAQ